jgi:hypothetical protein
MRRVDPFDTRDPFAGTRESAGTPTIDNTKNDKIHIREPLHIKEENLADLVSLSYLFATHPSTLRPIYHPTQNASRDQSHQPQSRPPLVLLPSQVSNSEMVERHSLPSRVFPTSTTPRSYSRP